MRKWFKKFFLGKSDSYTLVRDVYKQNTVIEIPEGWMVFEMGQSPLHMLWYCQMINKEDLLNKVKHPRRVWSEENNTYWEAMLACILAVHQVEKEAKDREDTLDNVLEGLEKK